ncbi:hypothetical protein BDV95DRAFT_121836 [Massariosphaeria phaeospora]|uniref:Uncharacterized protein n=1 Tax=Massariosphaeria phaeospora TaxID=100035 RepID=A0A7C8M599_9PLEO|nr:hypothetical protein BDV95DRAFT_121836 [Massariosphaeria phaeospora]
MRFILFVSRLAAFACAAELSIVGQNVTAGEEVEVTIVNATEVGDYYDGMKATDLKIGIFSTIYNYKMCSLTDFIPAQDGTIKVTVPPEMGPSGLYYEISSEGYSNPEKGTVGESIIGPGNTKLFFLSGGKGSWTPAETMKELKYGGLIGFANADIPCKSYPCAQDCAKKQFPEESAWASGTEWMNCLVECDGVIVNSESIASYASTPTSTVEVPESLPTPTEACLEEEFHTPCGKECCGRYDYCSGYSACVPLPIDFASLRSEAARSSGTAKETDARAKETGTAAKETGTAATKTDGTAVETGAATQGTGAASLAGMDWMVLGAAAGAFVAW